LAQHCPDADRTRVAEKSIRPSDGYVPDESGRPFHFVSMQALLNTTKALQWVTVGLYS
jgi:hypothetical protein